MSLKELISTISRISISSPPKSEAAKHIAVELQARSEAETGKVIVAPTTTETNAAGGAVALRCSDDDKTFLADVVVMLTDDFLKAAPGIADQVIRAFNTVEAAELAGDQEGFDFALKALRSEVDDARHLQGLMYTKHAVNADLRGHRKVNSS